MSYQKYYGRQFIKLEEDKYIPLVLWGANNCSELVNGREVLERYWYPLGSKDVTSVGAFAKWVWDNAEKNPNGEVWMNGSKWVCWANMPRWMANAFGASKTIEEIYEQTGKALTLTLYERQSGSGSVVVRSWKCTKTEEILSFFEFYDILTEEKKRISYIWYDFGTREPLKFPKPKKVIQGKVAIKNTRGQYLQSYASGKSLSFSPNPDNALVFENENEALTQLGRSWEDIKVVSVASLEKAKNSRNYALRCNRGYVQKRTKSHLFFTSYKDSAKTFATEKDAEKYKAELEVRFPTALEVVDIRKPFKPDCALIGEDGNIFNLMAIATRTLKTYDMADRAEEMCSRIKSSGSYDEALCIIGEYVNITSKHNS